MRAGTEAHPPLNLLVGLDDEFYGIGQSTVKIKYYQLCHTRDKATSIIRVKVF